jgi:hypothetical protein
MKSYRRGAPRSDRLLRLALMTAAGVVLLLAGALVASGGLSGGPYVAAQTTTTTTTSTTTQTTTPTTIRFTLSVKAHNGREQTRASGHGTLTLAEPPQQSRTWYTSTGANGVIKFHRWKLVGHRVLDEDDFTMRVSTGRYFLRRVAASVELRGPVTKAAEITTDLCYRGYAGDIWIGDGRVKGRPDYVGLEMCGVRLDYSNGIGGVRAVVTVKVETQ